MRKDWIAALLGPRNKLHPDNWEYRTTSTIARGEDDALNSYGEQGWELVGQGSELHTGRSILYWKRRVTRNG